MVFLKTEFSFTIDNLLFGKKHERVGGFDNRVNKVSLLFKKNNSK